MGGLGGTASDEDIKYVLLHNAFRRLEPHIDEAGERWRVTVMGCTGMDVSCVGTLVLAFAKARNELRRLDEMGAPRRAAYRR